MASERHPSGRDLDASILFRNRQASRVIAIELPHSHASCTWTTVMTMLDVSTFISYPYIDKTCGSWTITPGDESGTLNMSLNRTCGDNWPKCSRVDHVTVLDD